MLKDVFPQGEAAEVSIDRIQELVSQRFQLTLEELCGEKRSQNIVYPRQVAMYLSRELTDTSLRRSARGSVAATTRPSSTRRRRSPV